MLKSELKLPGFFEDPTALHIGCEENRSYFIPYAPGETNQSSRVISLNGTWDFRFYDNPFELEDFTLPGYRYLGYASIPVPGCIQMYGYDHHQYTNMNYPFPYDAPYVPTDNPTCVYHRCFEMTGQWSELKYYLNFEGVDSCFYVYINQSLVGYSQVSHSTSEFDITPFLKSGVNDLTVVVLKWCDGSYLEDQDKFRMTGIFRDVYLLARPKNHIRDFFVKTHLKAAYTKAEITVDFSYSDAGLATTCRLTDSEGRLIAEKPVDGSTLVMELEKPILWNAENPYLYILTIMTPEEVIYQKVGIRCIEIKDDVIHINGTRIKFKGTNRHDSDPVTGYTISREQAIKDLRLMKEANINAIRTSHYPNAPWFCGLCNEFGFYVIAESDLEAHGSACFYGAGYNDNGAIVQMEMFAVAILDRNQRNVIRDKNNPCIIMWSMGNEAGYSKAFEDTGRWIKAYDPTRLLHYEGSIHETGGHVNDTSMLDVYSRMYPPIPEIEAYFATNPKPYILCEFIHSMGNGPGDIEDYFDCIYAHDRLAGGFVWEWCDHAIYRGITVDGRKIFHYGGDSGEYPHDDNFCVDGMVSPDRIPHPALAEYKNVIRPVRAALIDADAGIVELENKLDFTNLYDYVTIRAELLYDGEVIEAYDLGSINLAPHSKTLLTVPYNKAYIKDTGKTGSVTLKLVYLQSAQRSLTPKGHTLGFDQLFIKAATVPFLHAANLSAGADISLEESNTKIIITGANFTYVFDKLRATFDSMVIDNRTILTKPMEYNIWRAPVDNDRNIRFKWENARFHRAVVRVYETKVTPKVHVTIHSRLAIAAIQNQHILDLNVIWHIATDGTVTVEINGKRNREFPFLPRFGLRFFLPEDYSIVNYLGYGPNESYIDKHRSSWYGRFTEAVDHMYVDYIKPQENSSHYHCNEVTLLSSLGNRIHITAATPFSFQTGRYTQEELTAKAHNYELQKADQTLLCLDYKMSGVGSNSCGPELNEKYQLCEEEISFTATLQMDCK